MSLSTSQIAHVLVALTALLVAAHGMGYLFARVRQPRVIGEILGGLLLGPTVLGAIAPGVQGALFPDWDGVTAPVLGAVYQLGLLLLMFCSGAEIRSTFEEGERKTALLITLFGTAIPFALGLVLFKAGDWTGVAFLDTARFQGPAQSSTAFLLCLAIAIAVTSIPVISRILFDLDLLETAFARIVLGAAVIEDILLYVVLAIALGMVGREGGESFGLANWMGLHGTEAGAQALHVIAPLLFFAISLGIGPRVFRALSGFRYNLLKKSSPIGFLLVFMLAMTGICVFLGVTPMFGAFVAGMVAGTTADDPTGSRKAIKTFAFAFFIPVYFALVGLKLDLLREFDVGYFVLFLAFACAAKSISVYLGARVAHESRQGAVNLAVAMNARGGPGIVLASVAYDAGIVGEAFYAKLVLLAVLTSLFAGSWLDRVVRSGRPLR